MQAKLEALPQVTLLFTLLYERRVSPGMVGRKNGSSCLHSWKPPPLPAFTQRKFEIFQRQGTLGTVQERPRAFLGEVRSLVRSANQRRKTGRLICSDDISVS